MSDLILIPTPRELKSLRPLLKLPEVDCAFQLCGFGPIAAAARAAALISRYKPQRVMLVGIAGGYDNDRHPLGSACRFEQVACTGVGVGSAADHQSADQIGWLQFNGNDAQPQISDVISLGSSFVEGIPCAGQLLTCCSASATIDEAGQRKQAYPDAVAEDMEGFGVAMACTLARAPLQIVRGISNRAGDRDQQRWQIEEALAAAAELAIRVLSLDWLPVQD